MKYLIAILFFCIPALAATKYPAYTDNANSTTFAGGATNFATVASLAALSNSVPASINISLLNGTNVFTGTNRFTGTVLITNAASTLSGNGAGLTNLNASNLASGTVPDARISSTFATSANLTTVSNTVTSHGNTLATNTALLNGTNVFTGTNRFTGTVLITNAASTLSGNGAGMTNLAAGNVVSGTLADARLSANVALLNGTQSWSGVHSLTNKANVLAGNGNTITNIPATSIVSGNMTLASGNITLNAPGYFASAGSVTLALYAGDPAAAGLQHAVYAINSGGIRFRVNNANVAAITPLGLLGLNTVSPANTCEVNTPNASTGGNVVYGYTSQTADLYAAYNASSVKLWSVTPSGTLVFKAQGSDPAAITGSAQFYAKTVAGTAEMQVMDGAGNITQLSPHARGSLPPEGAAIDDGVHEFPMIVHHRNIYVGQEEWVNLSALAADLEKVTGKKYVFRRPLADGPVDWDADQERQASEWRAEAKRTNDRLNDRALSGDTNALAGLVRTNFVKLKRPDFLKLK